MILSHRRRKRRIRGGRPVDGFRTSVGLESAAKSESTSKDYVEPTPDLPPLTAEQQAAQDFVKQRALERAGRLPGDELLSDIQARESTQKKSSLDLTKPIKDATVSKSLGSLREAAKDPRFQQAAITSIVQPTSIVKTVGDVGASLAAPELVPALTFMDSASRKDAVGETLKETAKTVPFALASQAGEVGKVAKTAAVAEIAAQTAEDINQKKSDADIATNLGLSLGSILPEGEATGKAFSTLTKGQKAVRGAKQASKVGKDVLEIRDALKPIKIESPEETAAERTSRILDANKNHEFTSSQLDNIQTHIDRHGYKPSKKLKDQLDTRRKDKVIEKVLKENPNVDLNETQVKNVKKFLDRNPNVDVSGHIGRQIDKYYEPVVVSFQDVDSEVREGFIPRQIRRVTPDLKTKEIDCSLLKGKKDRKKCEFNKKKLQEKRIKK